MRATRFDKVLAEARDQQAATGEILRVISGSPAELQPVLEAVAASAVRLCESIDATIYRPDGDRLVLVAHHGAMPGGVPWSSPCRSCAAPRRAARCWTG